MAPSSDPIQAAYNAVLGAVAGGIYGLLFFFRKRANTKNNPNVETEKIRYPKLASTMLVAALVGAIDGMASGPESLTPAGIGTRLAAYGGIIFFVEQVIKSIRDGRNGAGGLVGRNARGNS